MLDYAHLEALLAVEREKSFEGAAKALGVTSSAISQRIKLLEERIGAIALNRQAPISTTEIGNILCRHAETVLLMEDNIIRKHRDDLRSQSNIARNVKIVVNDDSLSSWFMDVLRRNSATESPYMIEISIADQDYSIDKMKSGEVLAAISGDKVPLQGFQSTHLGTHVYKATASPQFVERHFSNGVTIDSLKSAPALRYSSQDDLQLQWINQVFDVTIPLTNHTIPSSHGFVSACLAHVAWGMNPALMVDELIEQGKLVELVPDATLNKPLYWHCSRVIVDPFRRFTNMVIEAANWQLDQSDRVDHSDKILSKK